MSKPAVKISDEDLEKAKKAVKDMQLSIIKISEPTRPNEN